MVPALSIGLAAAPASAARILAGAAAGHYTAAVGGTLVTTQSRSVENRFSDLIRIENGVVTVFPGSTETRWDIAAVEPQSSAGAYGDLSTGKIGAFAATTGLGAASAGAAIADRLYFNIPGATASTITPVRFLLSVHAATSSDNAVFRFQSGLANLTYAGALATPYFSEWVNFSQYSTWVEGSTRYIDATYNLVGANPSINVEMSIAPSADFGSVSNYFNTAGLQLKLPTGVTYTSESGAFLTAAAIPEPATWGLLIAGFGLVGSAARRRRTDAAAC
jgi:hypothetical protein